MTVQPHTRRADGLRPLPHLSCVRGFESSLSIPLRAPRRHLPPQIRMPGGAVFHRAIRVETPTHDLIPRKRPPACFTSSELGARPSFSVFTAPIDSRRSNRTVRLLPCHGPPANRAYLGSCDGDHWLPASAPRVVFGRFRAFFFPTQGECRIYSSARTILAPVFPVLTRICAPSPWMHLL